MVGLIFRMDGIWNTTKFIEVIFAVFKGCNLMMQFYKRTCNFMPHSTAIHRILNMTPLQLIQRTVFAPQFENQSCFAQTPFIPTVSDPSCSNK